MGTATFHTHNGSRNKGLGGATAHGRLVTSGAHTTTTTASNLTDGAAGGGSAITMAPGQFLFILADEAMRLQFGGTAATATSGFLLPASLPMDIECDIGGTVSIIDVA